MLTANLLKATTHNQKGVESMKNRIYEEPKLEIVQLQVCDIITASNPSDPFKGEDDDLNLNV